MEGMNADGFWAALGVTSEPNRHFVYRSSGVFTGTNECLVLIYNPPPHVVQYIRILSCGESVFTRKRRNPRSYETLDER